MTDLELMCAIRDLVDRTDQDNGGDLSAADFLDEVIFLLQANV